jgi:Reactive mitochondrial oxygen species modulator 1
MSKRHDNELHDKYASNAVTFSDAPVAPSVPAFDPLKDTGDLEGFSSKDRKETVIREAQKKPDGLMARKLKRIFGGISDVKTQFLQGFKMGAIVGGIFGGLTGLYYAITTRSFMYIPMIALTSGGSFGFFMGVGMIMRSEMEPAHQEEDNDYSITRINLNITGAAEEDVLVSREPIFKRY